MLEVDGSVHLDGDADLEVLLGRLGMRCELVPLRGLGGEDALRQLNSKNNP